MKDIKDNIEVICVNLPWELSPEYTAVRAGSRWPHTRKEKEQLVEEFPFPFLLAYTAAVLDRGGIRTLLLDCLAEKIEVADFLEIIEKTAPRLIIAETSTPSIYNDLHILEQIKEKTGAATVLTGLHATTCCKELLEMNEHLDFVLKGEYELPSLELYRSLDDPAALAKVKGLAYRDGSRICENDLGDPPDLDGLPLPAREQLNMQKYNENFCMNVPNITLISSRGCPKRCSFCVEPVFYRTYRARKPKAVVDEILHLIDRYHPRELYFDDASFTINRNHVREICDLMLGCGITIPWSAMADAHTDFETLGIMKRAGLTGLKFGVESASSAHLDSVKKSISLRQVEEFVENCIKSGIRTHATYIFGCPGESEETIQETLEFAMNLNTDTAQFSCLTPFPGTPFYEQAKEKGWLATNDFSKFDGLNQSVLQYDNLPSERITRAVQEGKRRVLRNILVHNPILAGRTALNVVRRQGVRRLVRKCVDLAHLVK